jgi:hypothetical protein
MPHHLVTAAEDAVTPAGQRPDHVGPYPGAVAGTNRTNGTPLARSGARLGLGAAAPPAAPGPDTGLPRRPRQASLAPQLREPGSPAGDGQPQARSADQARTLFSSIQQGWRNGRAAAGQPDGSPGESPDGGPGSRTTPDEAGR